MKTFFKLVSIISVACGIVLTTDGMNNQQNSVNTEMPKINIDDTAVTYDYDGKYHMMASIDLDDPTEVLQNLSHFVVALMLRNNNLTPPVELNGSFINKCVENVIEIFCNAHTHLKENRGCEKFPLLEEDILRSEARKAVDDTLIFMNEHSSAYH